MKPDEVSGIILAGGYSSRMGRDKADLLLGDRRLVEIQTEKLIAVGIRDVMLSGYRESLPGTRTVPDLIPHRGPLSGLHACLKAAEHSACLLLSVDVPLIPQQTLRELISAHEGGITALCHGERTEPLMAVYDGELWRTAETVLNSEKAAIRKLLERAPVRQVFYKGDESLLTNCNTPEDYERVRMLWRENAERCGEGAQR